MCEIKLNATQLAAIYNGGNKEAREAIKEALGDQFSTLYPVTDRIKTFEDAYNELGEEHQLCKEYRSVKYGYITVGADLLAYLKLRIITTALNEGWEPQFIEGERRWYCWYNFISKEELEEMSDKEKEECRVVGRANSSAYAFGGLVFSYASHVSTYSSTHYGSRLAFKSEELAEYAGKQFIEIYADYCFIPASEEN